MLVGDICIYTLDGTLNSVIARRALLQCTSIIIESTIDPITLARNLYSEEVISENVYKRVRDKTRRDTTVEHLEIILNDIKECVKLDPDGLTKFVNILRELNRQDLADKIMSTYKGIIHYEYM